MQKTCYEYMVDYCSRYQKTTFELQRQLHKKGYDDADIATVMEQASDLGFIDDAAYAEQYLYSQVVRKGKPLYPVQQKLSSKGIDRSLVDKLVVTMEDDLTTGQVAKLDKEIEKLLHKDKDPQAIQHKLQARGYHRKLVQQAFQAREDQET